MNRQQKRKINSLSRKKEAREERERIHIENRKNLLIKREKAERALYKLLDNFKIRTISNIWFLSSWDSYGD